MRFMGRGEVRKQVEYPAKDMEHCFLHFDDMRAAGCKKLEEKAKGLFLQVNAPGITPGGVFLFTGYTT